MIMRRITLFLVLSTVSATAYAQEFSPKRVADLLETPSILRNSITNLHAEGDSLWVGPFLNLTTDEGATWQVAQTDSLVDSRNRLFSVDVEGSVIWAGLGFSSTSDGNAVQAAAGFVFSEDGGQTFTYRFPQLDGAGDSTQVYGVSTLSALPVIVPEQSPPFDIDYDPATGTVWVAGWASGIRRSDDQGRTWQRVVLPPDNLDEIQPDVPYDFTVEPQRGGRGWLNHMGFGILVDETGTVWAGTPAGVNRSLDGGVSWKRFSADGTANGLTGSWVISIEEQPVPGRNPVWMATWNAGEAGESGQFGITVTRDGGETFEQVLIGERVFDFAFEDDVVYAAGESGLFVSEDEGRSWNAIRDFNDSSRPDRPVRPDVEVFSVAVTSQAVWVGTSDGLVRSTDRGQTWRLFRTEVPLNPEEPTDAVPRVETFAYPNPFSPNADRHVRIRYELEASQSVEIRIFDFGMHLVRTLPEALQFGGIRETIWDGNDDNGLRVANGTYFYSVRYGSETVWGKILVLE